MPCLKCRVDTACRLVDVGSRSNVACPRCYWNQPATSRMALMVPPALYRETSPAVTPVWADADDGEVGDDLTGRRIQVGGAWTRGRVARIEREGRRGAACHCGQVDGQGEPDDVRRIRLKWIARALRQRSGAGVTDARGRDRVEERSVRGLTAVAEPAVDVDDEVD